MRNVMLSGCGNITSAYSVIPKSERVSVISIFLYFSRQTKISAD